MYWLTVRQGQQLQPGGGGSGHTHIIPADQSQSAGPALLHSRAQPEESQRYPSSAELRLACSGSCAHSYSRYSEAPTLPESRVRFPLGASSLISVWHTTRCFWWDKRFKDCWIVRWSKGLKRVQTSSKRWIRNMNAVNGRCKLINKWIKLFPQRKCKRSCPSVIFLADWRCTLYLQRPSSWYKEQQLANMSVRSSLSCHTDSEQTSGVSELMHVFDRTD